MKKLKFGVVTFIFIMLFSILSFNATAFAEDISSEKQILDLTKTYYNTRTSRNATNTDYSKFDYIIAYENQIGDKVSEAFENGSEILIKKEQQDEENPYNIADKFNGFDAENKIIKQPLLGFNMVENEDDKGYVDINEIDYNELVTDMKPAVVFTTASKVLSARINAAVFYSKQKRATMSMDISLSLEAYEEGNNYFVSVVDVLTTVMINTVDYKSDKHEINEVTLFLGNSILAGGDYPIKGIRVLTDKRATISETQDVTNSITTNVSDGNMSQTVTINNLTTRSYEEGSTKVVTKSIDSTIENEGTVGEYYVITPNSGKERDITFKAIHRFAVTSDTDTMSFNVDFRKIKITGIFLAPDLKMPEQIKNMMFGTVGISGQEETKLDVAMFFGKTDQSKIQFNSPTSTGGGGLNKEDVYWGDDIIGVYTGSLLIK